MSADRPTNMSNDRRFLSADKKREMDWNGFLGLGWRSKQQPRLWFCIYYSVENEGPNLINPHLQRALPPNPSYFISGSIDTRIIAYRPYDRLMHCWRHELIFSPYFNASCQGRSDGSGGYRYLYPQKSAQVNFLRGKSDVRTAIQQFYIPEKLLYPPPKKNSGYAPASCTTTVEYFTLFYCIPWNIFKSWNIIQNIFTTAVTG